MVIEIDDVITEKIVKKTLLEDYDMTCQAAKELLGHVDLRPFEVEDLELILDNKKAFEVLIRYYFESERAEEIIVRANA